MSNVLNQPKSVDAPFLKKYNERLELPISVVGSVVVHTVMVGLVVLGLFQLMNRSRKEPVPIMMLTGPDETGDGRPGSGNAPEALARLHIPTADDIKRLTLEPLPVVKEKIAESINMTPTDITIPDATAAGLASLDKALRDAILGRNPGAGDGKGTGTSGQSGTGKGGIGADDSVARSMRWVMRFDIQNGQDYLRQLSVLKATLLIPVPPENRQMIIVTDLSSGSPNRIANEQEVKDLARQMRFCDISAKAVSEIGKAFKLNFSPACFFAFFPKQLEERLAQDEVAFNGRKAKDIAETIFKITVTGDTYTIKVIEQTLRTK